MSQPVSTTPENSTPETALRCAAIVTASIAFGGLVIWLALDRGDTYSDAAASIARDNTQQRMMFSEKKDQLYVAVPQNAIEPRKVAPPQAAMLTATTTVAAFPTLPPPTPQETVPTTTEETTPVTPTPEATTEVAEATPTETRDLDAPYQPKRDEEIRYASTLDSQLSSQRKHADDERMSEPPPAQQWDDEPSHEPVMDEAPPDDPYDKDDPS